MTERRKKYGSRMFDILFFFLGEGSQDFHAKKDCWDALLNFYLNCD